MTRLIHQAEKDTFAALKTQDLNQSAIQTFTNTTLPSKRLRNLTVESRVAGV